MARLIFDTGALVDCARGRLRPDAFAAADDVAMPALVVAEFLLGVTVDPDPARQAAQRAFLAELLETMPLCAYDVTVAEHHAALLAHARDCGQPREAHDLIIAATARATDRTLLTTDRRARFEELPGLSVRYVG